MIKTVQCFIPCVVGCTSFPLRQGEPSLPGAAHDSQDVHEDVDDVSIEVQSSKYVLFWAEGQLLVA